MSKFEFRVGQEFRINDVDDVCFGPDYSDGDVFTVESVDKIFNQGYDYHQDNEYWIDDIDIMQGWVKLISSPIKVGDVYRVIDIEGVDGDGKMWGGDFSTGDTFTVEYVGIDERGNFGDSHYYLRPEWVGSKVEYLYNEIDNPDESPDYDDDESTPDNQKPFEKLSMFQSTIYDESYESLEEALVNELFYEYMEQFISTERHDFLEQMIDIMTYKQRKALVMYILAIVKNS